MTLFVFKGEIRAFIVQFPLVLDQATRGPVAALLLLLCLVAAYLHSSRMQPDLARWLIFQPLGVWAEFILLSDQSRFRLPEAAESGPVAFEHWMRQHGSLQLSCDCIAWFFQKTRQCNCSMWAVVELQ